MQKATRILRLEDASVKPSSHGKDLTGMIFDRLTVVGFYDVNEKGLWRWLCKCSCGKLTVKVGASIQRSKNRSCGCLGRELFIKAKTVHGRCRTPEHYIWGGVIARCLDVNNKAYPHYGGRGIKMCDRWRNSFVAFFEDMGPRPSPGHSLDRYPDNNGNYEPGNCRWATLSEQNRNKRTNRLLTFDGITKTITEWSEITGLPFNTINNRIIRGCPHEWLLLPASHSRSPNNWRKRLAAGELPPSMKLELQPQTA